MTIFNEKYIHPKFGEDYQLPWAIQHIEDMISSLIKKDPKGTKIRKSDCAYIYYDGKEWRAFYPSVDLLLGHHMRWNIKDSGNIHSCNYCSFIKSEDHKKQRIKWGQNSMIVLGE